MFKLIARLKCLWYGRHVHICVARHSFTYENALATGFTEEYRCIFCEDHRKLVIR